MKRLIAKTLASIQDVEGDDKPHGGFTAILSTPSLDRDGDRLGRKEWIEPLPERMTLDVDHGMKVADTIGSVRPYFDGDTMMIDATFASTAKAQEVRTLVKEGHVSTVSIAFMTDKTKKDAGSPFREVLNCGVVAIPSNRDAMILDSKALDLRAEELAAEKATAEAETDATESPTAKAPEIVVNVTPHFEYKEFVDNLAAALTAKAAGGDAPALTQAIHDAAVHLGAICYPIAGPEDPSGASEGANKSADESETKGESEPETKSTELRDLIAGLDAVIDEAYRLVKGQSREGLPEPVGQALDLLSAAHESVGSVMEQLNIFDPDADEGYNKSANTDVLDAFASFATRLSEIIGIESPAESPAEDASEQEPSEAAVEAADESSDDYSAEVMRMQLQLSL